MSDTVLIGGVFDPLHAGHLAYIREAQKYGPVLCVLSDAPQKHPPLVPRHERARLLTALDVMVVGSHSEQVVPWWLEHIKPKYYIKGGDWIGKLPAEEVAICRELGITIIYTDTVTQSSSALLADYERRRNTEKLAAFETFVRQQKPAEMPWEPVTDYSWEARKAIEAPHAQLIKDTFSPSIVLDYGAGYGHLVRLLRAIEVRAFAYEPHLTVHADARPNLWGPSSTIANDFDLVICREVLEHVPTREVQRIVRFLVGLSTRYIYVTTRFTAKSHLLDVDGADDLDPTHITLLSQDFLRTLFVLEGCRRRADLEAQLDWRKLGRVLVYEVPR